MPGIIRKIFPITPSIINTIPTDLLCLGLNKDIIMPMKYMARYPQSEYSCEAPSSITIFAKKNDKFVNQKTLK